MADDKPARISPWEWIAAGVASAIVVTMVVTLLVAGRRERTPPRFAIAVDSIAASGADYLVRFTIRNEGSVTGAEVQVEGELTGVGDSEKSSATFDFVPGGSRRHGGMLFRHDPRSGQLTLRPVGYREP
jgi:uncharacterized protein (TIGR02588 family)